MDARKDCSLQPWPKTNIYYVHYLGKAYCIYNLSAEILTRRKAEKRNLRFDCIIRHVANVLNVLHVPGACWVRRFASS